MQPGQEELDGGGLGEYAEDTFEDDFEEEGDGAAPVATGVPVAASATAADGSSQRLEPLHDDILVLSLCYVVSCRRAVECRYRSAWLKLAAHCRKSNKLGMAIRIVAGLSSSLDSANEGVDGNNLTIKPVLRA